MEANNNEIIENTPPKKEPSPSRPEFFLHIIKSSTSLSASTEHEHFQDSSKSTDGHHENSEIGMARQKIKEISESIDNEEQHLKQLEERRQQLEREMERLHRDIEMEKELFRQQLEADLARKAEYAEMKSGEITPIGNYAKIDPLSINTDEIEEKLREYREAVEDSQLQTILHEDDADIKRLRENLVTYKRALAETRKEKIVKQKRKAAAKIFQKHLDEVDLKCNEQISKISSIQRSIGSINISATDDIMGGMNI